jgi:Ni/Fe-hydrogenase subunit HybB-like protein
MIATTRPLRSTVSLSPLHVWLAVLATFVLAGLAASGVVFTRGLVVTNLTDLVPWGLWITLDLSSIAIAAGAFSLTAAVYVLGIKRLEPLARTATFIGLIGYSMAVLTLILDIGRPDRFWHALVFWNPHSVLWDVTMSVTLYFSVLLLESLPILARADRLQQRWPRLATRLAQLHRLAPVLASVGLGLSLIHQSSLGATYGVLKARPVWYRPDLSVLFIISAVAAGQAATVLATMLVDRVSSRFVINDEILDRVSHFIGWVILGYLYFRFWDAFSMTYTYLPGRTEGLRYLTRGPLAANFWLIEMLLGAVVPSVLLLNRRLRRIARLRMLALALIIGGVVTYRWDINLLGQLVLLSYLPQDITARYTEYVPSVIEWVTTGGIVAYGLLAFTLGARYLRVVDHPTVNHGDELHADAAGSDCGAKARQPRRAIDHGGAVD